MSRIFLFSLLLLTASAIVSGQSGRRIAPKPTPEAAAHVEETIGFSESFPQSKRIRPNLRPNLRADKGKGKKSPKSAKNDTKAITLPDETDTGDIEAVITVKTELVTIPVSVFDRNGIYVPYLRQTDFKIFEDGKEQEIAYFGTSDKPFTVVLLLDTSPSTEFKIDEIQRAATAFVDQLQPQDRVMVIEFDEHVNVLTEPTGDRQQIYSAIQKADFGSGTSLYEAVEFTLKKRLSKVEGRKAIVLFTDGVDTTSKKGKYDASLDLAEESDTLIFPIYYNTIFQLGRSSRSPSPFPNIGRPPVGTTAGEYALGRQYLEELAASTGGRIFKPEATPGGLTRAFEGIAEELRRQYNIGYIPSEEGSPGQRKQIKVRVNRPNLVIRSRDSYIVGGVAEGG